MKNLLTFLLVIISLAYPVLVYIGIQHVSPAIFALMVSALALMRFFTLKEKSDVGQISLLLIAVVFSIGLFISNSEQWLKLYPVIISICVATVFALSLRQPETIIERMARLSGATITPRAKHYTRALTRVWVMLLIINGLVALYLAGFASLESWTLYTGLLSYIFFGLFFALEYGYRCYYINRYRDQS